MCPVCNKTDHKNNAEFCYNCGGTLNNKTNIG